MTLKTAAPAYDVKLSTLRDMCLRKKINGVKVGMLWYVTPAEMDRVFKGIKERSRNGR